MAYRPVHRLEELLTNWEDWCLMQHTAIAEHLAAGLRPPCPMIGAYKNWSRLRADILKREIFDWQTYGLPKDMCEKTQLFPCVPFYAWSWNYWSRRAYSLSRDLQALLLATTTRGITYADIVLPFQAFVIELPRPLLDADQREYDAIMVASGAPEDPLNTDGPLMLVPLRKDLGCISLPDISRNKLRQLVAQRRWDKAEKLHGQLMDKIDSARLGGLIINRQEQGHLPVVTPIAKMFDNCSCGQKHQRHNQLHEQVVRLVVGLCLYLKTLPSGSPHASAWSPLNKSARFYASAVTNGANICDVGHEIKLDARELAILESQFIGDEHAGDDDPHRIEIKAHFRTGYWRRPPGKGHDPDALKIVHVRPTFVRREKLAEGFVPEAVRVKMA